MSDKVLVKVEALKNALSLLETREWPIKYMFALGEVAKAFEEAIGEVPDENQSTDQD